MATYKTYIDLELKEGNPVRIRSIYERRITDHCLIPLVWHEYSQYLEEKLKDFESSLELLIRAVRNCNWSGALWVRIVKCCERLGQSKSEICKHLEAGLVAGLVSATDFRDLWLAYLDYRRRQLAYDDDDECLDKGSDFAFLIFLSILSDFLSGEKTNTNMKSQKLSNLQKLQFLTYKIDPNTNCQVPNGYFFYKFTSYLHLLGF